MTTSALPETPYTKTILPNGLRLITAPMPHTRSVTVSIYVGAGARYETKADAGISHFFKRYYVEDRGVPCTDGMLDGERRQDWPELYSEAA